MVQQRNSLSSESPSNDWSEIFILGGGVMPDTNSTQKVFTFRVTTSCTMVHIKAPKPPVFIAGFGHLCACCAPTAQVALPRQHKQPRRPCLEGGSRV